VKNSTKEGRDALFIAIKSAVQALGLNGEIFKMPQETRKVQKAHEKHIVEFFGCVYSLIQSINGSNLDELNKNYD
jgi:hypothetical protein